LSEGDRTVSSDEMIRRAREGLLKEPSTAKVAAEATEMIEVDAVGVDSDPELLTRDTDGPPSTATPRRPHRRMPAPVATPPTGPADVGRSSRRGLPWFLILAVLIGIGRFGLPSSGEESAPVSTTQGVPASDSPSVSGAVFRDEFNGPLASGWVWVNETRDQWSLTDRDGSLRLSAALQSATGSPVPQNVLLRKPVGESYEITTHLEFVPTSNFQSAGLIVYDDGLNYVQLVRAFCGFCDGKDGIYLDTVTNGGVPQSDFGHRLPGRPRDVYLRIRVTGTTISGSYSVDGTTWRSAGVTTKTMSSPRIGIVARPNDPRPPAAYFDFFEVMP
jgi:hypothetical protein